jgi:hypothetical protein
MTGKRIAIMNRQTAILQAIQDGRAFKEIAYQLEISNQYVSYLGRRYPGATMVPLDGHISAIQSPVNPDAKREKAAEGQES